MLGKKVKSRQSGLRGKIKSYNKASNRFVVRGVMPLRPCPHDDSRLLLSGRGRNR